MGAQVALSVALLAGAALLITSLCRLGNRISVSGRKSLGRRHHIPTSQYPDAGSRQRFVEQLLNALRDIPGVQSATVSGDFPLQSVAIATLYARADRDVPPVDNARLRQSR